MTDAAEAATSDRSRRPAVRVVFALAIGFAVAAFAVYGTSLNYPFFFDDLPAIVDNPTIRGLDFPNAFWAPRENPLAGRPVANFTFALNHSVSGQAPWGFRVVNVTLHVANALLIFGVVALTVASPVVPETLRARPLFFGAFVAALWLVHPLHVETVVYVTQRTESLATFFYLATLFASIKAWGRPALWTPLAVVACLLGMLSKEILVTCPIVVMLHDVAFSGRGWRDIWKARRRLYVGLALSWLALAALLATSPRPDSTGFGHAFGPLQYAATQCWTIARYVRLTLVPVGQYVDYGYAPRLDARQVLPGALLILAGIALTAWGWARCRPVGFLGAWFFLILGPTSSVMPIVTEVGAERRMYLPSIAILAGCAAVAFIGYRRVFPRESAIRHGAVVALGVAAILGFALLASTRTRVYQTPLIAWSAASEEFPANARAWENLAHYLLQENQIEAAHSASDLAVEVDPANAGAWTVRGATSLMTQDFDASRDASRRALELDPDSWEALYNLALADVALGRNDEALDASEKLLDFSRLEPRHWTLRATVLLASGRREEALDAFGKALRVDPANADTHAELASALARTDPDEALRHFLIALEIRPNDVATHLEISALYDRLGLAGEAIRHARFARDLDPGNVQATALLKRLLSGRSSLE